MEEQKTIKIGDTEYLISDLSIDAIRYINQLISIDSQVDKLNFDIEQLSGSREWFTRLLMDVLPESR